VQLEPLQAIPRPNKAELIPTHEHFGQAYVVPATAHKILGVDLIHDETKKILEGVPPSIQAEHQCYRLGLVLAFLKDRAPSNHMMCVSRDGIQGTSCCLANVHQGDHLCQPQNRSQAIARILEECGPLTFSELYGKFAETTCFLADISSFEIKVGKLLRSGFLKQLDNYTLVTSKLDDYIDSVKKSKARKLSAAAKERIYL
jgi:hypothetical protein